MQLVIIFYNLNSVKIRENISIDFAEIDSSS